VPIARPESVQLPDKINFGDLPAKRVARQPGGVIKTTLDDDVKDDKGMEDKVGLVDKIMMFDSPHKSSRHHNRRTKAAKEKTGSRRKLLPKEKGREINRDHDEAETPILHRLNSAIASRIATNISRTQHKDPSPCVSSRAFQ